jgi:hypothetical protein
MAAAGNVDGARGLLDELLRESRDVDHVSVAVAEILVELGERERACQELDRVVQRRARDPRVVPSLEQVRASVLLSRIRVEAGDVSDPLLVELRQATTWLRRLRGNEHTESLAAMRCLATLLQSRGEYPEARTLIEYVGAVFQRNVSKSSEDRRNEALVSVESQFREIVSKLPHSSQRPHSAAPRAHRGAVIAADAREKEGTRQPKWRMERMRKRRKEQQAQALRTR